ncbi:exodeoxyribonuclease V subunit alpha [Lysobacter sp. TY2-98]|uniref:exodeoxyribonuclease V subunit alpha n=1 Tax=Lysobacter sp. TY2-98 TaxID=2290922 RepID=UPI000E20192E|nr:exodeoxyribonuclease V subunit alpha [Lysobacter sp. TY2-98]AXK73276.1 exodeoxyribonuclease V subunit alpha [Lysobacter sp. TY2-98]
MSLLDTLQRSGAVRPIDLALAHALQRVDGAVAEPVLVAAALASYAVAQGHAAFDLDGARDLVEGTIDWPDTMDWREALAACTWIAKPDADVESDAAAPLVVEQGRVYLRRYREYERRLAIALTRLSAATIPPALADIDALHARLFPQRDAGDAQAEAARRALESPVLLVTGGPGTGKTTTIARVLLLLAAQARATGAAPLRIALAAPTGRAADRMAGSVRRIADDLRGAGIDAELCDALPTTASTLHRLLGLVPGQTRARFDAKQPLRVDVLVVDEASMVDLPLMCKLAEALPTGARLLLLGDRDQLPSVEAGDVLAALADAADVAPSPRTPLAGRRAHLDRGYRQTDALRLEPVADAVRRGDVDATLARLRGGASGVTFHEDALDPLTPSLREQLLAPWRELRDCTDPREALARVNRTRLLTALRDGPQGATQLNARIEAALAGTQRETYFPGRLLMITENSTRHGLFNGDVGVCLRDDDGTLLAWFEGADGVRAFPPGALPAHTGGFAITVHKAQGSEFDRVWLQLPAVDTRVLSRELLYTGITRARSTLHVLGPASAIASALSRHARRVSGLARRLGA